MAKRKKPSPRKHTSGKSQIPSRTEGAKGSSRQGTGKAKSGKKTSPESYRRPTTSRETLGGAANPKSPRSSAPRVSAPRDLEADMDAREELLEGSLEQVVAVYEEALDEGVHFPVVFLVDCEDSVGGKLARDWAGREAVEEAIESNRSSGKKTLTTTFAQTLSFADGQEYVPRMFPYLQGTFEQAPPEGTFVAVVVARGGAATFFVPL